MGLGTIWNRFTYMQCWCIWTVCHWNREHWCRLHYGHWKASHQGFCAGPYLCWFTQRWDGAFVNMLHLLISLQKCGVGSYGSSFLLFPLCIWFRCPLHWDLFWTERCPSKHLLAKDLILQVMLKPLSYFLLAWGHYLSIQSMREFVCSLYVTCNVHSHSLQFLLADLFCSYCIWTQTFTFC